MDIWAIRTRPSAFVARAADAVARTRQLGFATVIFSNQSGIAHGLFDEEAVQAVNARVAHLLLKQNPGAIIDRQEYCPTHPRGIIERYRHDNRRKPGPGMIYSAADALALDLENSWVIGDAPRNIEAGRRAGCKTILFADPDLPPSTAAVDHELPEADLVVTSLAEALDFIASQHHGSHKSAQETLTMASGTAILEHRSRA